LEVTGPLLVQFHQALGTRHCGAGRFVVSLWQPERMAVVNQELQALIIAVGKLKKRLRVK
jgi:hypothetical protein